MKYIKLCKTLWIPANYLIPFTHVIEKHVLVEYLRRRKSPCFYHTLRFLHVWILEQLQDALKEGINFLNDGFLFSNDEHKMCLRLQCRLTSRQDFYLWFFLRKSISSKVRQLRKRKMSDKWPMISLINIMWDKEFNNVAVTGSTCLWWIQSKSFYYLTP